MHKAHGAGRGLGPPGAQAARRGQALRPGPGPCRALVPTPRSRRNAKQLYEQTIRNLNYGEYFDAVNKNLVQLPNGKFAAYDIETYTQMRKDGKIRIGSFDTLIDPETGEPPLLPGATVEAVVPTKGPVEFEYQDLVERLKAGGVEGVLFQAPKGDTALALLGGDKLARTEVKASWKKAELVKVMARLGVPNNFAELSVVVPGITSTR